MNTRTAHATAMTTNPDRQGLLQGLIGDGRPLLTFTGLFLALCGGFAVFQAATGHFLPHDVKYLGMDAAQLCALHQCRIVHFMFHDRVAFGGVLIALGLMYLWLAEFPLRRGEAWAWRALAGSGASGFASFFSCIGYGYLDTWHGAATLVLVPCFVAGLARSRARLDPLRSCVRRTWDPGAGVSRAFLIMTAAGMMAAGLTITIVGATRVFVPQDLRYMGLTVAELRAINPRLVPLIAHDRAGFGGSLFSCGVAWLYCMRYARPSRSLWQALCASGCTGFVAAIGVHLAVGYLDVSHLAPAFAGALIFAVGIILSYRPLCAAPPSAQPSLEGRP